VAEKAKSSNLRNLRGPWEWLVNLISALTMIVVVNHIFHLDLFGTVLAMETSYLYLLLGFYGSLIFLIYPIHPREKFKVFPYFAIDIFLFVLTLSICLLLAFKGLDIYYKGWMMVSPAPYPFLAGVLLILVIEATRRSQGLILTSLIIIFGLFPLYTQHLPGFLNGIGTDLVGMVNYHVYSVESLIGLPMRVTGNLVIGFMLFGLVLAMSGGGSFFMAFALAIMGKTRGGAAKVAVMASALFGSISGSALSNIVTTGTITIPAMGRTGYPWHFAAAVEACASTGGVLMPPIMGATAFLLAEFLDIPYLYIAGAAFIPSILYYTGLMVQVDAHAARHNLIGLTQEEIPSVKDTLKKGWFYLGAIAVLLLLLFFRLETQAPFYSAVFLLVCSNFNKETRLNKQKIKRLFSGNIETLSGLIALIAAIGLIIGALSVTGVAHGLSRELIYFAGNNAVMMVILGAMASFILGMGITITACYVLLAITLAPPLVQMGLDPLAVHLFLLYCGMLSYLTLPVATSVYTAAGLCGASSLATGLTAMRLGIGTYIVPFFFVFNPALIGRGTFWSVLLATSMAFVGIWILTAAFGGYLVGVGNLADPDHEKLSNYILRPVLFVAGIMIGLPEPITDIIGIIIAALIVLVYRHLNKSKTMSALKHK